MPWADTGDLLKLATPIVPRKEEMLTMWPPPRSSIFGKTALIVQKCAIVLTLKVLSARVEHRQPDVDNGVPVI